MNMNKMVKRTLWRSPIITVDDDVTNYDGYSSYGGSTRFARSITIMA